MIKNHLIMVAVPAISHQALSTSKVVKDSLFDIGPFSPEERNLDCFSRLHPPMGGAMWAMNVPGWDLSKLGISGVAGPGKEEALFHPESLRYKLEALAGTYDKWRPYPAESPLSTYAISMAKKFAKKRGRMFEHVCSNMPWDKIFYVEHSPASLAHLDEKEAMLIADSVMERAIRVSRSWSGSALVIFSPYGTGRKPGFVVSNMVQAEQLSNWDNMRKWLRGENNKNQQTPKEA